MVTEKTVIPDNRSLLEKQRGLILDAIVDLAAQDRKPSDAHRYRSEARTLLARLAEVDKLIETIAGPQRFSNTKNAGDVVIAYLNEIGYPQTKEDIIQGVAAGGFTRSKGVGRAIGIMLTLSKQEAERLPPEKRLRKIGSLIGLMSWDDSKFESSL